MKKIIIAAVAAVALSACAAGEAEEAVDVTAAELPGDDSSAEEDPTTEEEPAADDMIVGLGESFTWDNGMTVKVEDAGAFTPSDVSAGGEGFPAHRKFIITIKNDTDTAYNPGAILYTLSSAGAEGDEVFDNGLDGWPETSVLPGKSVSFPVGYGVMDPEDLQLDVAPDFDYYAASWVVGGDAA